MNLDGVSAKGLQAAAGTAAFTAPAGYGPADIQSAYALDGGTTSSPTVAIVDAYDNPNAESDLALYRAQYGLPACATANGCFRKVNQNGASSPPPVTDVGWGEEIALDLDMVSATCPACKILLVEASSNSLMDLGSAVNTGAALGAVAISNSYGGGEYSGEVSAEAAYYNHPGVAITASSGDSGYGVEFPAASRYVTAVGGTTLVRASNARGWGESTWSGSGAGCSALISKPSWQKDTGCPRRTVADVSAVADPATGVAVADTFGTGGTFFVFGGTSVASPIIASVYALKNNTASLVYASNAYANTSALWDIQSGADRRRCSPTYLCTAGAGYDGPTGLGTPRGLNAF
jgi:subtilase family serine protease